MKSFYKRIQPNHVNLIRNFENPFEPSHYNHLITSEKLFSSIFPTNALFIIKIVEINSMNILCN